MVDHFPRQVEVCERCSEFMLPPTFVFAGRGYRFGDVKECLVAKYERLISKLDSISGEPSGVPPTKDEVPRGCPFFLEQVMLANDR